MKLFRILFTFLVAAGPLFGQELSRDEFITKLGEHTRLRDDKGYDKTVRENPSHTIMYFRDLAHGQSTAPDNEENQAKIDALLASWQRVFESSTLEKVQRWVLGLDSDDFRKLGQAQTALYGGYTEFARLRGEGKRDRAPWESLGGKLMEVAEAFEFLGEYYHAADSWGLISQVYVSMPEQTILDRKEAVFAIERFKDHREQWDLTKDRFYIQNINWLKAERERINEDETNAAKRAAEGYGEDVRGVDSYLVVDADKAEITIPLEFKALSKPNVDMSIQGGPVPMMWPSVEVIDRGPAEMKLFQGASLFVLRPGSSRFGITRDASVTDPRKAPHDAISAANKIKKPSEFALDDAGEREYAMWFYVPSGAEPFQGMSQNYAPTPKRALLYYKSASSWIGQVDKTPIVFYDDNSNGKIFEEDPFAAGFFVRTLTGNPNDETRLPAFDGMKIGKGPVVPYSEWVQIDGSWYHLRPKDGGKAVGLRPANPDYLKAGRIAVDWSGPKQTKLEMLIVQGKGDFERARFDIAQKGGVEVPAGNYVIQYGRLVNGKGPKTITCDVLQGRAEEIVVEAGKSATLSLGAPFKLDYERGGSGRDVKINALSIRIVGAGGELYMHPNGAVPSPEVRAAKAEDGKGAKVIGEFKALDDPEVANQLSSKVSMLGYWAAFFPIVDGTKEPTLEFQGFAEEGSLIGLGEDKNKLFGKLEPIYK